ncbi:MAG TPA: NeuD/PglB/VioB family sugar acetyltransferase [Eoetvoesiella sp.]
MARTDIVLVGARGLAKELLGYLEDDPRFRVVCVLDETPGLSLPGYEVISPMDWTGGCHKALFSVGYPEYKRDVLERYAKFGFEWQTYIHPQAVVSRYAQIGAGCIFAPFTVVAGNAEMGDFVFMNVYSAVGHDSKIGQFSSLMPYACADGYVALGEECLVATGAKILPKISIGDRSRVSAGSIVMRNMPEDSLIYGNPAKHQPDVAMLRLKKKMRESGNA